MKNKIAILLYPAFSIQEIANCMALFRWYCDSPCECIAKNLDVVTSEEGMQVLPHKSYADFQADDYDCIILPGTSDFRPILADTHLKALLQNLQAHPDLVIGAICGGPFLLSWAGLLEGKAFVNQLYVEMNEAFPFIQMENFVCQPLVESGNIITAIADAYADFAIALARKVGHNCPDHSYRSCPSQKQAQDYLHKMSEEDFAIFQKEFAQWL